MRLGTGDGIICDKCWTSHKGDFTYYSTDIYIEQVVNNIVPRLGKGTPSFSFDICEQCDNDIRQCVIKNFKPTRRMPNGAYNDGVYCEITGVHKLGNYEIGYAVVDKVIVSTNNCGYACTKCGTPNTNKTTCKCGGTEFHRKASVRVDRRNYEFIICDEEYTKWRNRSLQLRQNPETGQWSTNQS